MVLPELDAEVHFWLFLVLETVLQIASYGWKAVGVAEERRILPISGGMWLPHRVFIAFSWYLIESSPQTLLQVQGGFTSFRGI